MVKRQYIKSAKINHVCGLFFCNYYDESAQDYYPFGSLMPGRNWNSSNYKNGFNGMLADNEISGYTGTHYSAEFWEYDSRIGRRWNRDPVIKPYESPYATFANNPINVVDPLGNDGSHFVDWIKDFFQGVNTILHGDKWKSHHPINRVHRENPPRGNAFNRLMQKEIRLGNGIRRWLSRHGWFGTYDSHTMNRYFGFKRVEINLWEIWHTVKTGIENATMNFTSSNQYKVDVRFAPGSIVYAYLNGMMVPLFDQINGNGEAEIHGHRANSADWQGGRGDNMLIDFPKGAGAIWSIKQKKRVKINIYLPRIYTR